MTFVVVVVAAHMPNCYTRWTSKFCPKGLNAARNAALLIAVPAGDASACTVAPPHVRHEQLPALLTIETCTHSMLRRLVDQETAYLGTNAGSAGLFYLFAATEQSIHD